MSMMGAAAPVTGEKVAGYTSYESAQKAVSTLIAADIPAREIAIVGHGLRSVETVTGRLGYAAAARSGAINGILLGLVMSLIFVFGTPDAAIQLFLGVMLVGVALGMLTSLITFSFIRRRRDFASVTQVTADHYDVMVQPTSIHRARSALGVVERVAAPPVVDDTPPRYGERLPAAGTTAGVAAAPATPGTADPAAPVVPAPEAGEGPATVPADGEAEPPTDPAR